MRFGVDEAGKGPVLGSMFAAAVRADPVTLPDGVGDSKDIKPERRERLAEEIRESADAVGVAEVPVERIDADETDMNTLTVDAQATALSTVARDNLSGTVDAGDTDATRFGRRVADAVDADVTVTAEHGADETDTVVGAASIIAKVARDAHVAELAVEYGDVGSGYPSDPTTRAFLADYVDRHGELPACARRSWSTCDDVLAAASQSTLGDF
ncbi:ribonuclease HII [Haloarcula argentinensis]|uniref:Ribonuclease HII n=1 Tax=Haloarcula argentinensis TaxID=43776 RepID=A0A830FS28_HALAR|nr:ribonuclease HII [Haloarcula argentinensis]EMA22390.1 ribonuclease HII [Haloarcula argentinensis DSM 12282]MDS0252299.1 ribonuclease HII [Haloarcula argentinensis]GGM33459.1 ribonuclease HII [Haloarcula argentinensis]